MRTLTRLAAVFALALCTACSGAVESPGQHPTLTRQPFELRDPEVMVAQHDVSSPHWLEGPATPSLHTYFARRAVPRPAPSTPALEGALQLFVPNAPMPTPLATWEGLGDTWSGYSAQGAPPDPNGDVGLTQYVQAVNTDLVILDKKTGKVLGGPQAFNKVFQNSSIGNGFCAGTNQGDPVVLYDEAADRWMLTQFAFQDTSCTNGCWQCVAVSKTGDATGAYNLYAFGPLTVGSTSAFNDYGKFGVWNNAYYGTYNMFAASGAGSFLGPKVCAMDRASMLAGGTATQQCFDLGASYFGVLAADIDGAAPPAGSDETVIGFDNSTSPVVETWQAHVDWSNTANTKISGPNNVTVSSFTTPCGSSGTCIPESGGEQLDALAGATMFRAAYRNFGTYESLVGNFTVATSNASGVRWFELRNATGKTLGGATPVLYQDGTWAPADGVWRWMGSIAQDASGNIAVGYSASSTSIVPELRWAGHLASDPKGVMGQTEGTIAQSLSAQNGWSGRWGDYSDMTVDPSDGCTFYYTGEYYGSSAWATKIGSFKFPSCTGGGGGVTHYGVGGPSSVNAGSAATFTLQALDSTGAVVASYAGTATVTSSDGAASVPTSVVFNAGVATMSVTLRTAGSQTVTATDASSGGITGSATVTVNVSSNPATHYQLSGLGGAVAAGTAKTVTVSALDASNNVAGTYAGTGHLTSTDAQATLSPSTLTFTGGVAMAQVTFKTMGAQSLTATDAANASITGTASTTVTGGPAVSYELTGLDAGVAKNSTVNLTVTARDAAGNVASYTGSAAVTSSDGLATLPTAPIAFQNGAATAPVKFGTLGTQTITFTDTANSSLTVTGSTHVAAGAPTVSISSPSDGSTVHGTVLVTAVANGASGAGISSIEIDVDGTKLQSGTSGSLAGSWDTSKIANGAHKLTAKATDTNGVSGTSQTVNVTVSNTKSSGGGSSPGCGCGTSSPAELAALGLGLALFLRRRRYA